MVVINHYHENPDSFSSSLVLNTSLSCIPRSHSQYIYTEETDQPGHPEKEGYYEARTKDGREIYAGSFVLDNEHGNSIYKWIRDEGITAYEGYMYCNFIHGYGRFSYPDGSVHEGLYKHNRRYGPGIHTEPNGKQNVGMWNDKKLLKLSVNVNAQVPTLSHTHQGREKALQFKDVQEIKRYNDKAKDIFYDMNAPSHILKISDCLYNALNKDPRSETFDWKPYEELHTKKVSQILHEEYLETLFKPNKAFAIGKSKRKGKFKLKDAANEMDRNKVVPKLLYVKATNLICWNNSSVMKDMMLFCFKYLFEEDAINYDVADIAKGNRECFRAPGTHETLCVRFLKKCQIGDHSRVHDYLAFKCIDPNLADSEGNSGLIIAAANDQLAVIDVLLDHGADINLCNDDGFSPLSLCLTRYLGLVYNFNDWEKEFLSNPNEINYPENTLKWRHPGNEPQSYYRYLDDIADNEISTWQGPAKKEKNEDSPPDSEDTKTKIALVRETIFKLIQRGADPEMSVVPMPTLIMAIKCRDEEIVRSLLEARCNKGPLNPDDPFLKDALYTAVQLPADDAMVSICATLLEYGADPNSAIECSQEDERMLELCELSEDEIGEKTVLHYLATRPDGLQYNEYLCEVVKLLLLHGANPEPIYLGQTPLSAAIAKGNTGMIKCLISLQVNQNQKSAKELGVPLTHLIQNLQNLPITDTMSIIDTLVNNGADLLTDVQVGSFTGNIIEFIGKEIEKSRHDSKKSRPSRRSSKDYQALLDYITKLAQQELMNKIKESLTKRSTGKGESGLPQLPSWIGADDIVDIINNIQEQEKSLISKERASEVLQMMSPSDSKDDDQLRRSLSRIKGASGYDAEGSKTLKTSSRKTGENLLGRESKKPWDLLAALKRPRSTVESRPSSLQRKKKSESDKEGEKTDVCFGCGRTFNEDLLRLCPECEQVKFCSPECFWKARRNKTHKCTGDIFPDWKDRGEHGIDNDQQDKQLDHRDTKVKQEERKGKKQSSISAGDKKSSLDGKGMKKKSVKEEAGIQDLPDTELEKGGLKDEKRSSQGKQRRRKQSDKEETGIQDLPEKELAKQHKREIDVKTKDRKFYGDPETKKKRLTKKLFKKQPGIEKSGDTKRSIKSDFKKEADNIAYKTPSGKRMKFEKYPRGQGDYTEDKYHKVDYIADKHRKGTDTPTIIDIKDGVNRLQQGRGDIRKEDKYIPRQEYTFSDFNLEPIPNECSKISNYNIIDIQSSGIPHMFKDGSIYYTNDSENKKISKSMEQENYAFN